MRVKHAADLFCFGVGDRVFLRPRRHRWLDEQFVITRTLQHNGWPHYELLAPNGSVWTASQLELSASSFALLR